MADPALTPQAAPADPHDHQESAPRADLKDAVGWLVLGIVTLVGSLRMDRLESQNINPYTVPGLLPGLLGLAMILLGAVMGLRSWQRGALTQGLPAPTADEREQRKRVLLAIALCCGYAVVLVGHGLPFWLASTLYVTASILLFQRLSRDEQERRIGTRPAVKALVIGVLSSVIIWIVFERIFLVRMP